MDHRSTEKNCLKTANGCLLCNCPPDEFADCSGRYHALMLVENVIREFEKAAAGLLDNNKSIKTGCICRVAAWGEKHNITE